MRTCRAQLQSPAPAALYGWLRPMPFSRTHRPSEKYFFVCSWLRILTGPAKAGHYVRFKIVFIALFVFAGVPVVLQRIL